MVSTEVGSNVVVIGGESYEIKPISFMQGVITSSILIKYIGKSSGIISSLMSYKDMDTRTLTMTVLRELHAIADEEFNEDILQFTHVISNIPKAVLITADAVEVIDQLPTIVEHSKLIPLMQSVWNKINDAVNSNNTSQTG